MVQTSTLGKIAVYGAIASVAGAAYLTQRIHGTFFTVEYMYFLILYIKAL